LLSLPAGETYRVTAAAARDGTARTHIETTPSETNTLLHRTARYMLDRSF
jgi:hypothetical protein